ncbi:MAG: hypothetical protein AMK72_04510 [Planctomycetes bacterium SM23_25]|nr:MAG: hypothetical protein AMK72_04510 [Planctomycetes bacterium SM23_25]
MFHDDPDHMTADERLGEVATLLAAGFLRLKLSLSPSSRQKPGHFKVNSSPVRLREWREPGGRPVFPQHRRCQRRAVRPGARPSPLTGLHAWAEGSRMSVRRRAKPFRRLLASRKYSSMVIRSA